MPFGIICSTRLLGFLSDSLQIKVVMGQLRLMKYIMHFKCNLDWSLCSCAVVQFTIFFFFLRFINVRSTRFCSFPISPFVQVSFRLLLKAGPHLCDCIELHS